MMWDRSWKYTNNREATQTWVRKHWKKKNQRLSLVILKFSQINSTFDSNFIQWVASVSQNNFLVIFKNKISAFADLKKTLINNSDDDQDTEFKKKQICVNEINSNVFEKDEVLLFEKISDWKKLNKLIDFQNHAFVLIVYRHYCKFWYVSVWWFVNWLSRCLEEKQQCKWCCRVQKYIFISACWTADEAASKTLQLQCSIKWS